MDSWQILLQQPDAAPYVLACYILMGISFLGLFAASMLRRFRLKKKQTKISEWS